MVHQANRRSRDKVKATAVSKHGRSKYPSIQVSLEIHVLGWLIKPIKYLPKMNKLLK